MSLRTFTMLAHVRTMKTNVAGWIMSEKLDGMRAMWDGGITRGIPVSRVPFANRSKDAKLLVEPISTGLWTRYGHVIKAPDWWINTLPIGIPLDGELYSSYLSRQELISIIKGNGDWTHVKFYVFGIPDYASWLSPGVVRFGTGEDVMISPYGLTIPKLQTALTFIEQLQLLNYIVSGKQNNVLIIHHQEQLSLDPSIAEGRIMSKLEEVGIAHGEGLILRHPNSYWEPCRSKYLLKVKIKADEEDKIVGFIAGEGKYLGMLGSLILSSGLRLSGMTDAERILTPERSVWCSDYPGAMFTDGSTMFHIGQIVTYEYRGRTRAGIPMEAQYKCVRDEY